MNHKRVYRLWRAEGLTLQKQKKKRIKAEKSGGIGATPATRPHEVWSYDFVFDVTQRGARLKIMPILDEYTRRCLALVVDTSITAQRVTEELQKLFDRHGAPSYIRSDNGPEYRAQAVQRMVRENGSETLFIPPGSPWENGFTESFNARLRDEVLNREEFWSVAEAQVSLRAYRRYYNEERPHSSLDYQTPSGFAEKCQAGSFMTKEC